MTSARRRRGALERLLAPLDGGPVDNAAGSGQAAWLRSGDWRLLARPRIEATPGDEIARFALERRGSVSATRSAERGVVVPFSLDEALENYLSERWRSAVPQKALSRRQLSLFY